MEHQRQVETAVLEPLHQYRVHPLLTLAVVGVELILVALLEAVALVAGRMGGHLLAVTEELHPLTRAVVVVGLLQILQLRLQAAQAALAS